MLKSTNIFYQTQQHIINHSQMGNNSLEHRLQNNLLNYPTKKIKLIKIKNKATIQQETFSLSKHKKIYDNLNNMNFSHKNTSLNDIQSNIISQLNSNSIIKVSGGNIQYQSPKSIQTVQQYIKQPSLPKLSTNGVDNKNIQIQKTFHDERNQKNFYQMNHQQKSHIKLYNKEFYSTFQSSQILMEDQIKMQNQQKNIGQEIIITPDNVKRQSQKFCKEFSKKIIISNRQIEKIKRRAFQKNKRIQQQLRQSIKSTQQKQELMNASTANSLPDLNDPFSPQQFKSSLIIPQMHLPSQLSSQFPHKTSQFHQQISQKIYIHFQILTMIATYAQSFDQIYENSDDWQQLIFLLYKKYYIQRVKVYQILKNGVIKLKMNNNDKQIKDQINKQIPFKFNFCQIKRVELDRFRESNQEINIELKIQKDNIQIKNALRDLYNKIIVKNVNNIAINMFQKDDLNQYIIEDLHQEITLLIESSNKSLKIRSRINQAIQIGLLIGHLSVKKLDQIEEIITGNVDQEEYYMKFYQKLEQIYKSYPRE